MKKSAQPTQATTNKNQSPRTESELTEAEGELLRSILRLVSVYMSAAHSKAVREGIAKRKARLHAETEGR